MENERKFEELEKKFADLEAKLKATLQKDENVDVPMPMRETLFSRFSGEMRKYAILTWSFLAFFSFLSVVCFLCFLVTDDAKLQLMCMSLFVVFIMHMVLMKLWYWQIHSRYNITREVKRLELRIAELTEKLEKR